MIFGGARQLGDDPTLAVRPFMTIDFHARVERAANRHLQFPGCTWLFYFGVAGQEMQLPEGTRTHPKQYCKSWEAKTNKMSKSILKKTFIEGEEG